MTPDYEAGYLAGATWGIDYGRRAVEAEHDRDEHLARRIVAMLIQHDYNGQFARSVIGTKPYRGRTVTGMNWREFLAPNTQDRAEPHDLWPVGHPADWTDEPTPDPT